MKPSRISETLKLLIDIQQPAFVWGAPGVGKSQVVAQTAGEKGRKLVDVRAVLLDPVDLRGLPRIDSNNRACWCPPEFLPATGKGVLFLDELNAAPPLVQAACYQLVLDRRLGEYKLPDGWSIIAAGNRETDRAVTHRMPSALANRFVHLDFQVDAPQWLAWAQSNRIAPEVVAFIRFRPTLLHAFDPQKDDKAFPTPRSWEFVSRIMNQQGRVPPDPELIGGVVGEGAAAEFCGFLKIFHNLPDPDDLLKDPETAHVPNDPATLYAVCELLSQKADTASPGKIMTYAGRLPPEFSVLLVRDAARINSAIVGTPDFNSWAAAHADVLI